MKRLCKITLLMLAVMQAVPMQAMWTQAARTALAAASKRTLNSHAVRSLSSITPDEYVMQSPAGVPKLSIEAVPADAPAIDAESSDTFTHGFEDARDTFKDYRFKDNAFRRHHFGHKQFLCRSLISALAVYAYMSTESENAFADEAYKADEPKSSRVCDEPEATELIQLQSEPYTYTVNLMWVNRKFEPNQKYIHPSKTLEELEQNLLNTAYGWAASNPESTVNIWYDSAFLIPEAIQNTQDAIDAYSSTHPESARIVLKDVRELSLVQDNPEVFSDKIPVYFRVDLLRLIATIHILEKSEQTSSFVYTDIDINPIAQKELFDCSTIENLTKYGMVLADVHSVFGYENSFHIITNQKPNLLKAIMRFAVELNIIRAQNVLRELHEYDYTTHNITILMLQELVYESYPTMLMYFYHLEGLGKLFIHTNTAYDYDHHGLEHFGVNVDFPSNYNNFIVEDAYLKANRNTPMHVYFIPTKKIIVLPLKPKHNDPLMKRSNPLLKTILPIGTAAVIGIAAAWWLNR